jgi:hypothetical protein
LSIPFTFASLHPQFILVLLLHTLRLRSPSFLRSLLSDFGNNSNFIAQLHLCVAGGHCFQPCSYLHTSRLLSFAIHLFPPYLSRWIHQQPVEIIAWIYLLL